MSLKKVFLIGSIIGAVVCVAAAILSSDNDDTRAEIARRHKLP